MFFNDYVKFPLGYIEIFATDKFVEQIHFTIEPLRRRPNYLTDLCKSQIISYLNRNLKTLDCPYKLQGTEFQIAVWQQTAKIPYGKVITYKDLAIEIGKPKAFRAVAMALKKNKLPIIIPCHRVIYNNFKLGGYSAGVDIKKYLLWLENYDILTKINPNLREFDSNFDYGKLFEIIY